MIPRIHQVVRLGRVPVPHTNEATYAVDGEGRRWVAKREIELGCEALLAEALTWLLAREVGAPTPDAAWHEDANGRSWLSEWVPHAKHWSVSRSRVIANPAEAAAILALDAVVCNEARHSGNLLEVPKGQDRSIIIAIDGDEALIGHPRELARRGRVPPSPRILARGFPPPDWRADALIAAARFAAIPFDALSRDVRAACALAQEPAEAEVLAIVADRCAHAIELTDAYLSLIEART